MVINGSNLCLFIQSGNSNKCIGLSLNCKISISSKLIKNSTKDTSKYEYGNIGRFIWYCESENLFTTDNISSSFKFDNLFDLMIIRKPILLSFGTVLTEQMGYPQLLGFNYLKGTGIITRLSQTSPDNQNTTYNIVIEGTNSLTPVITPIITTSTTLTPISTTTSTQAKPISTTSTTQALQQVVIQQSIINNKMVFSSNVDGMWSTKENNNPTYPFVNDGKWLNSGQSGRKFTLNSNLYSRLTNDYKCKYYILIRFYFHKSYGEGVEKTPHIEPNKMYNNYNYKEIRLNPLVESCYF